MHSDNDPQYKTDEGAALRIWRDTAKNNFQSEAEGRAIFDEVIYVEVITPGSGGSAPVFEVLRTMSNGVEMRGTQFEQYAKYINDFVSAEKSDASMAGTPLAEWPEISRSMAASLRASQIFSVDALAGLPDTALVQVGPDGRTWREKAKAFLAASKDASFATKMAGELEVLRGELADRDTHIAALAAKIDELQRGAAPAIPGPGPEADPLALTPDPLAATKPAKAKAEAAII